MSVFLFALMIIDASAPARACNSPPHTINKQTIKKQLDARWWEGAVAFHDLCGVVKTAGAMGTGE